MPVEIKELIIRAVVQPEGEASEDAAGGDDGQQQEAIVEECVRQVLRILKKTQER